MVSAKFLAAATLGILLFLANNPAKAEFSYQKNNAVESTAIANSDALSANKDITKSEIQVADCEPISKPIPLQPTAKTNLNTIETVPLTEPKTENQYNTQLYQTATATNPTNPATPLVVVNEPAPKANTKPKINPAPPLTVIEGAPPQTTLSKPVIEKFPAEPSVITYTQTAVPDKKPVNTEYTPIIITGYTPPNPVIISGNTNKTFANRYLSWSDNVGTSKNYIPGPSILPAKNIQKNDTKEEGGFFAWLISLFCGSDEEKPQRIAIEERHPEPLSDLELVKTYTRSQAQRVTDNNRPSPKYYSEKADNKPLPPVQFVETAQYIPSKGDETYIEASRRYPGQPLAAYAQHMVVTSQPTVQDPNPITAATTAIPVN